MNSLKLKVTSLKNVVNELERKKISENEILSQISDILFEIVEKIDEIEHTQVEVNEYVTVLDEI
jgi:predicted transcriptional regulator